MGQKTAKEIMELVRMFKAGIKEKFAVDSLILFGSAARGKMTEHSDVDIIVVSRKYSSRHFFSICPLLYDAWHIKQKIQMPVDILLYSREEFEKLSKEVSIVSEAIREGKRI